MDLPTVDVQLEALADGPAAAHASIPLVVHVTAPDGWHVYWGENPGQTGLPTAVKVRGAPAESVRWSAPVREVGAGDIVSYAYLPDGYAVTSVATGDPGPLHVDIDVSWLVCKDTCIPGKTTLSHDFVVEDRGAVYVEPPVLPEAAPASLSADGLLRICLPRELDVFPNTDFEALGVALKPPKKKAGSAWTATVPADARGAIVFTDPAAPDSRGWRVSLDEARQHPTCE